MILSITHRTSYHYGQPVSVAHHALRLEPRPRPHQSCLWSNVTIDPLPTSRRATTDYFGNLVQFITLEQSHSALTITGRSLVELRPPTPPLPDQTPPWDVVRSLIEADLTADGLAALEMCFASPGVPILDRALDYARPSFPPGRPVLAAALDLTARIHKDFTFDNTATTVATPIDEVFALRRGVCQDFAHLQIACLRALGLSARYVSGYLQTHPPAGQPKLIGVDASHAWLSLWIPGRSIGRAAGRGGGGQWVDLDPTNDLIPQLDHVTLAWGRDYGDVAPIRGVILGGGDHAPAVAVDVLPATAEDLARAGLPPSLTGDRRRQLSSP